MTRIVVAGPTSSPISAPRIQSRRASEVEARPVAWLWEPHFALGKLSMVVGDPGLSKSTLSACISAHISSGKPWPDGKPCPCGEVLLVNAEDDPSDTTRPRLDAAGAIVERVHFLDSISDGSSNRTRSFNLADVEAIDEFIGRHPEIRLVVIDPISAFLAGIDSHKNSDVRGLLAPISALAARRGVAVLGISHLNKGQAAAIYRSSGSLAFVAAARSVYLLAKSDDLPQKRLLLPVKNNLGPDTDGIAFLVEATADGVPFVQWLAEPVRMRADEALEASTSDERSATEDCGEWLQSLLREGAAQADEVFAQAERLGFSRKTLRRARERLGVATKKADFRGGWIWSL